MFEQAFRNIDDVLRKEAGCTTELDYTEQTSWLLFLKYLDDLEQDKSTEAALEGRKYTRILDGPYRWVTWAAPEGTKAISRPFWPSCLLIPSASASRSWIRRSSRPCCGSSTTTPSPTP